MNQVSRSSPLSEHQQRVADRVLGEERARRRHLVVSLSGAHAYGFPSPDSDLDLKAVHIEPTTALLGLMSPKASFDRLEVIDGVEIDYTSNEIHGVVVGVLGGNGNYAERILGPIALETSPEHDSLRDLAARAVSKRIHRHYRGFATSQLAAVMESEIVPAKRVLYVLRTALTGTHALRTGVINPNLAELFEEHGFPEARRLIEAKKAGERSPLPADEVVYWRSALARAFEVLDAALTASSLSEEPSAAARADLERWLLDLRRAQF